LYRNVLLVRYNTIACQGSSGNPAGAGGALGLGRGAGGGDGSGAGEGVAVDQGGVGVGDVEAAVTALAKPRAAPAQMAAGAPVPAAPPRRLCRQCARGGPAVLF